MTLYRNKYRIESARLQGWDYSLPGYYFVTICAYDRQCIFGEIRDGRMDENQNGVIVRQEWEKSFEIRHELKRDDYCVMPNHFHAIIRIVTVMGDDSLRRDVARNVSAVNNDSNNDTPNECKMAAISPKSKSLSTIIRSFKSAVTNRLHAIGFKGDIWQPRFYDHIIRNDRELFAIRQYIKNNPRNWANDRNIVETNPPITGKQFVYSNRSVGQ